MSSVQGTAGSAQESVSLSPYRAGFAFSFFNAMTWMIALGTPMVLLMESLGATPFQVGLAYAWVFLLLPVQVVSTVLIPMLGYRKQVMLAWGSRAFMLAIPLWLALKAPATPQPWMVHALVASIFGFCLLRALGSCAVFPWLYAWIPENVRGRYFATDQTVTGVSGVITLIGTALLFSFLEDFTAYAASYAFALLGAILAVASLTKWQAVPNPRVTSLGKVLHRAPELVFEPGPFRYYLVLTLVWWVVMSGFGPFTAYYLKSEAGIPAENVLYYSAIQYLGAIVGALVLRNVIDSFGVRPFFFAAMALLGLTSLFWLLLVGVTAALLPMVPVAFFVLGIAMSNWWASHLKYLPQLCHEDERALAVSVQSSVTGVAAGVAPILWGLFLKDADGTLNNLNFAIYFGIVLLALAALGLAFLRIQEQHPERSTVMSSAPAVRFVRALASMINLIPPEERKRTR